MKKKKKSSQVKRTRSRASKNSESWIRGVKDTEVKRVLEARAKLDPKKARSARGRGTGKVPAFIYMRPPCNNFDCPEHDPDHEPTDDPCGTIPWVWYPELAVQLHNRTVGVCPPPATLKLIRDAIGRNLSRFRFPDPEVRVSCKAGVITILVWGTRVTPGSCNDKARERAQFPYELPFGVNFGIYVRAGLISRLASEAFAAAPKTIDTNGAPNPFGPIHLTGVSLGFEAPNLVHTYVSGYDDRPWPDVDFTVKITDTLSPLRVSVPTSSVDYSVAGQVILFLTSLVASTMLPLLFPLSAFVLFNLIDAAVNQPDNPSGDGAGGRLWRSLPDQISLPQSGGVAPPVAFLARSALNSAVGGTVSKPIREKLVIIYGQPQVDIRGIFAPGIVNIMERTPAATLAGPSSLAMFSTATETTATFDAQAQDFFGTLTYSWTGGSNVVIHSPSQARTKISFKRGNASPGDAFDRTIKVRVTDSEGSTVTASRTVALHVNDAAGLPPICQIRPWLPQCQPGGIDDA